LKASYTPENFPAKVFISGNQVRVQYTGKRSKTPILLSYSSVPVDSTTLYCSGISYLTDNEGDFGDGSISANYINNASCKWQIAVPDGKRIRLEFDEFDTQPKTDCVWLFEGTETLQENILGRFSGPDLPPVIISPSNKVLIWFVTDNTGTSKGWHLLYKATDEQPGILPAKK
jgi:serine protease